MSVAVRLVDVHKSFRRGDRVLPVLAGVDIEVRGHEVVALLGPSGCGKTTLLRILAGSDQADTGTVQLSPPRRDLRVGVVFQHYALYPWMTVERNVAVAAELVRRLPRREARALALERLEEVGLREFAGHYPAELSGGMQQRVALARGFAVEPHLLLMDEPFAALDALTRSGLHALTQRLVGARRTTAVFVTHDAFEAALLADRVVVLTRHGTVAAELPVAAGRPRDVADLLTPPLSDVVRRIQDVLVGGSATSRGRPAGPPAPARPE